MSKEKDAFIKIVKICCFNDDGQYDDLTFTDEELEIAKNYFEKLQNGGGDAEKPAFTEKGTIILKYLQSNPDAVLPAKKIAEELDLSSRTVSGAMKKLVTDGYVEKFEGDPKTYSITEKGKEVNFTEE